MKKTNIIGIILFALLGFIITYVTLDQKEPTRLDVEFTSLIEGSNEQSGLILNEKGEVVFDNGDYQLFVLSNDLIKIKKQSFKKTTYGLMDTDGNIVLDAKYKDIIYNQYEGFGYVNPYIIVENNDGYIFLDENLELTDKVYDFVDSSLRYHFVNVVTQTPSMQVEEIKDNVYRGVIVEKDGKQGLVDEYGNILIEVMYESIYFYDIENELFIVELDSKFGIINQNNEIVLDITYDLLRANGRIHKDDKIGYVDKTGSIVFDPIYDDFKVETLNEEVIYIVSINRTYGVLDKNKNTLIPLEYEYIHKTVGHDDYFELVKDGKEGLYRSTLEVVIPSIYDELNVYDTHIFAHSNGFVGIIDFEGNILLPLEYDSVMHSSDSRLDGEWFDVTKNGVTSTVSLEELIE